MKHFIPQKRKGSKNCLTKKLKQNPNLSLSNKQKYMTKNKLSQQKIIRNLS